jgi:tetratricopeptide (TPR) repeat protein
MFELIAKLIIVFSTGGILVIIVRKIPAFRNISEEDIKSLSFNTASKGKISQKIKKINYQNIIQSAVVKLEKILRKLRIIALRFDNRFERWIQILKDKEQELKTKTHLSKIQWIEKRKALKKKENKFILEEKKFIKTIVKNPSDVNTYRALGLLYLKQKNYKDAKASFKQILKIDSKDKEAKEKLEEIEKNKPS